MRWHEFATTSRVVCQMAIIVYSRSFKDAIYAIGIILGGFFGLYSVGFVASLIKEIWDDGPWQYCSDFVSLLTLVTAFPPIVFYHLLWFERGVGPTRKAGMIRVCKVFGIITLPIMILPTAASFLHYYAVVHEFYPEIRRFSNSISGQSVLITIFLYWITASYLVARQLGPLRRMLGFDITPPKTGWTFRQAGKLMLITIIPFIYYAAVTVIIGLSCK